MSTNNSISNLNSGTNTVQNQSGQPSNQSGQSSNQSGQSLNQSGQSSGLPNNKNLSKNNNKNNPSLSLQEQNILSRLNNIIKSPDQKVAANINKAKLEKESKGLVKDKSDAIRDDNYMVILSVFITFIIFLVLYFLSKTFNVGRTLSRMQQYDYDAKRNNYKFRNSDKTKLQDVMVISSYNCCHSGMQMYSYSSENVLLKIIKTGCRYLEFNVFSSKYGDGAKPVINCGYRKGEYRMMLNNTPFEECMRIIALNAFTVSSKSGGCPNPNDPLFISFNLNTGYNTYVLDNMADILIDYFHSKLLTSDYSYQFKNDIQNIKMKDLQNRVVIFASKGFEGSKLEELVNSTWIDHTDLDTNPNIRLSLESFTNYNKSSKSSRNMSNNSSENKSKKKNIRIIK